MQPEVLRGCNLEPAGALDDFERCLRLEPALQLDLETLIRKVMARHGMAAK